MIFIRYESYENGKKGFADECFHPMAKESVTAHGTMENIIRCTGFFLRNGWTVKLDVLVEK